MKIQVVSDLHLEFGFPELETDKDTILIIAGDLAEIKNINHIKDFYDYYSLKYRYIIEVPGNHSYYNNNIDCVIKYKTEFLSHYNNCILLDNEKIVIDNINIYGTILWSDFNKCNYLSMFYAQKQMIDYRLIKITDINKKLVRYLEPEDTYKLCISNKQWLFDNMINEDSIVITHHAPSLQSISENYKLDDLNGAYASDMEIIMYMFSKIKLWVHGHMHESFDYTVNETRVICNPRGYFNENKLFDNNLVINL